MQREKRYLERTNSISRGKRSLEVEDEQKQQPERKRPALASVIVEALKLDHLQKLCSSFEPILRRVVSEEVERALANFNPSRLDERSSQKKIEGPDGRNLQLRFSSRLSLPLFTGGKVEGEQGAAIHVVLSDANTGHVVTSGPEASAKLDVVVLEGDFNKDDDETWAQEEFESNVVKERDGKRPLLHGDLQVTLKEGVGTLGELIFTDNSSWIRSRKFRLGLKFASDYCEGIRVREAKTEAFIVKDHRGELYKKHYPPALNDDVWRLEKIGKDGAFHKKLNSARIFTVEDFLQLMVRDHQKLRNILGSGMSNKMWEALAEHAKTCVLSGKLYVYYPEDSRNIGVVFNNIYALSGLFTGEQYFPADSLSDHQKVYVDTLVKKAYENWNQVIEYDGESLLNFKQSKSSDAPENDLPVSPVDYSNTIDHRIQLPQLPVSVPNEQSSLHSEYPVAGYNENIAIRYANGLQIPNSSSSTYIDNASFGPQAHVISNPPPHTRNHLPQFGMSEPSTSTFHHPGAPPSTQPNLNQYNDWAHNRDNVVDNFFSEEEIRMRSHEMLENEDMQQYLRLLSLGGHGSMNTTEYGFSFPSFMQSPMPNFDEDRAPSGKAVVGWLKIKAAMRWGFFIRKKAAERRAQIVEIEDEE